MNRIEHHLVTAALTTYDPKGLNFYPTGVKHIEIGLDSGSMKHTPNFSFTQPIHHNAWDGQSKAGFINWY